MILAAIMLLTFSVVLAGLSRAHRSPVTAADELCARVDAELDAPQVTRRAAA